MLCLGQKQIKKSEYNMCFFGDVPKSSTLIESDEGSLEWVKTGDIENQNVTLTTNAIVKHYNHLGGFTEDVYVGSMKSLKGKPAITRDYWKTGNYLY